MSGPANGLLTILGLVALFLLAIGLFLWVRARTSKKGRRDPEAQLQREIQEQITWRAMAQGGGITVEEAVTHGGRSPADVERALMIMVAEGRARAEPGDDGQIVYRIEMGSSTPGVGDMEDEGDAAAEAEGKV
ncbi:MAG: hypothetical protein V3S83_02315 [Gemmatimonadota bacterium]